MVWVFFHLKNRPWVGLGAGALTAAALAYHESTKVSRPGDDGADMMIIILPLFVASTTVIGGGIGALFTIERWRPLP